MPEARWSIILFGFLAVLMFPVHECAHYSTYRALGIPVQMTLNTALPNDRELRRPIAELAGPLLNLGVSALACTLYLNGRLRSRWFAEAALAAAMLRLVVYALVIGAALVTGSGVSLGNDEPIAAQLWGVPSLTFVVMFSIPLAWIVGCVARVAWESRTRRMLQVSVRAVVTLGVGLLVGFVLDPWLFPRR